MQIMEHTAVSSVHTTRKQHQRVCMQICGQIYSRVLCERGLTLSSAGIGLFWLVCYVVWIFAWRILTRGPAQLFRKRKRTLDQRPRILNNPDLGSHATVQLSQVQISTLNSNQFQQILLMLLSK